MTPAEKRLLASVLRLASDKFANHGCNDFDMTPDMPREAARDALVREARGADFRTNGTRVTDYRLGDFEIMRLFAQRLESESK